MMEAVIDVAAGFVQRDGRFLLCCRPLHKSRGGQWEFPGGKLEPGESYAQALERELMEELCITVRAGEEFAQTVYTYPELTVRLRLLAAVIERGEPRLNEHTALRWVTKEQALTMDLCPADRILLCQLEDRNGISG